MISNSSAQIAGQPEYVFHKVTSSICCSYLCDIIEKSPECPARLATPLVIMTGSQADKRPLEHVIREYQGYVGKPLIQ